MEKNVNVFTRGQEHLQKIAAGLEDCPPTGDPVIDAALAERTKMSRARMENMAREFGEIAAEIDA